MCLARKPGGVSSKSLPIFDYPKSLQNRSVAQILASVGCLLDDVDCLPPSTSPLLPVALPPWGPEWSGQNGRLREVKCGKTMTLRSPFLREVFRSKVLLPRCLYSGFTQKKTANDGDVWNF